MKRYIKSTEESKIYYHYSNRVYEIGETVRLQRLQSLDDQIQAIYAEYLPNSLDLSNVIYMYGDRDDSKTDLRYCYEVLPKGDLSTVYDEYSPIVLTLELPRYKKMYPVLNEPDHLNRFIHEYARSFCMDELSKKYLKQHYDVDIYDNISYITNSVFIYDVHDLYELEDSEDIDQEK